MSRTEVIVSPEAELDIGEILQYTLVTWRDEQVDAYDDVIWSAFRPITQ